jgi:hypothetical protein
MKLTRTQKQAKLRKAADAIIEQLLAWDEENSAPNLTQMVLRTHFVIEDEILALRQRMGEEMLTVVLAGQAAGQPAESPKCSTCGAEMRYKGQKGKAVESRVGGLEVERGYYYCARCQSGLFPPGPAT